jgi:O-methyltransferase domain
MVVEHVLPPGDEPSFGKLLDLNMLLSPSGVERTADGFRRLFEGSGFRLTRIGPTEGDLSMIVGEPG